MFSSRHSHVGFIVLTVQPRAHGESCISFDTTPTIGVEMDRVVLGARTVTLREVGSAMAPTWPSYFAACRALMFVIDRAHAAQLGHASTALHRALLALPASVPVVIVLNKCDAPAAELLSRALVDETLRVDDIRAHRVAECGGSDKATGSIFVVDGVSARETESLPAVVAALEAAVACIK